MKKSKVLASFLALTLVTQGIPANVLAEEVAKDVEKISVTSMNSNIKRNNNSIIKDASLEAGIRERLKLKPDQELTKERLEGITELNLPNKGIESLEGLENCKGLKKLNLRGNKIIDIEPIKELCEKQGMFSVMTYLDLRENKIQDISPIKDMSRYLNTLYLENQNIEVNESVNKADMNGSYETECTLKGLDGSLITPYAIKANGILNGSYSQGKINWTNLNDDSNKLEYEYSQNDISFGFGGKANFTGKVTINLTVKEETVNIPDKNLENKLIELLSYKGVKVTSGNITKSMLEKFDGSLDLIGLNITNPEGLQYTKVKYLDLANNKLSDEDLSVIKEIKTLESLDLHDNNISNISDLSGLTKLIKLELANNKIENISALEDLVNIEELDLSNDWEKTTNKNVNKISDISVLSKLTKLKYIKLDGNAISDITPIKDRILNETIKSRYHEKQIIEVNKEVKASDKTFDISNDIKGFDDDITIEVTNGTYKDGKITVTDLEKPVSYTFKDEHAVGAWYTARFSGTVNVKLTVKEETVNIPDKNLENKLIELLSYKGVKVTSGNITKSMLEKFDGSLDLIGLNITDPEGLQYTKVKYLDLANNKLSNEDLSVIKEIKTLESLDLHDNNISNISDLSGLTKLTKLELANNKIENISALEGLVNIEELDLSNDWEKTTNKNVNKISDISVLSKLTKLKYIKLNGNAISDITPIKDRILNETIKSRYHEKQVIEVNKEVKASDKTFDISNDIKGFDDDITIEVTNGTYKDGKITVTDLEKPVSYTFKDEHAVGAWYTARFSGTVNVKLNIEPSEVIPKSFNVKFVQSNGKVVKEEELRGSTGIFAPRMVMPNGEMAVWKADCIDLVLYDGDYVSAQTLGLDFTWTEKEPTIIFKPVVMPKSFTVKFVDNGKVIKEEVLRGYRGIEIPRIIMPNGEMAVWKADCVNLTLGQGDFMSAQTLDLDFLWTDEHPTIVFNIAE